MCLPLVLCISTAVIVVAFNPAPHNGGDNAAYITLAFSLAEHGTYTDLYDPAEMPHTKYPPVFPGLLALMLLLGARTWSALKTVSAVFTIAAVGFTYLWAERRLGAVGALGLSVMLAISPALVYYSHWILSDPIFLCFTMAALWALERSEQESASVWWLVGGVATVGWPTLQGLLGFHFCLLSSVGLLCGVNGYPSRFRLLRWAYLHSFGGYVDAEKV